MKTLVIAEHVPGPAVNGHDGCHARLANDGICPGVEIAKWLNGLGEDDEKYTAGVSIGEVRYNWIRNNQHVEAKEPKLAELLDEERRLLKTLQFVRRRIKEVQTA